VLIKFLMHAHLAAGEDCGRNTRKAVLSVATDDQPMLVQGSWRMPLVKIGVNLYKAKTIWNQES